MLAYAVRLTVLSLVVHSARSASEIFVCCLPFFWSGCDLVIVAGCFHLLLVVMLLLGLACHSRRFGASVALLFVRDERCARRGVADETLPTARATQCWCLLLDNQTERPGTPCLVKEGASQTSRHSCAPPHWVRISWYTSAILRVSSCHAWHAALASVLLGRGIVLCGKPMQSLGCWTGKDASLSKLTVFCPGECDNRLSQMRVLSGFVSLALVVSSAAARVSSDVLRAQSLGLSG